MTVRHEIEHAKEACATGARRGWCRVVSAGRALLGSANQPAHMAVDIRATCYTASELEQHCISAHFAVEAVHHRPPLRHEHQGERVYVVARAT